MKATPDASTRCLICRACSVSKSSAAAQYTALPASQAARIGSAPNHWPDSTSTASTSSRSAKARKPSTGVGAEIAGGDLGPMRDRLADRPNFEAIAQARESRPMS